MLAVAAGAVIRDPGRSRLRIGEEALVTQAVLVRERGERLAQLHQRPEQQPFGFLAVAVEGRRFVRNVREPCADRVQIIGAAICAMPPGGRFVPAQPSSAAGIASLSSGVGYTRTRSFVGGVNMEGEPFRERSGFWAR